MILQWWSRMISNYICIQIVKLSEDIYLSVALNQLFWKISVFENKFRWLENSTHHIKKYHMKTFFNVFQNVVEHLETITRQNVITDYVCQFETCEDYCLCKKAVRMKHCILSIGNNSGWPCLAKCKNSVFKVLWLLICHFLVAAEVFGYKYLLGYQSENNVCKIAICSHVLSFLLISALISVLIIDRHDSTEGCHNKFSTVSVLDG